MAANLNYRQQGLARATIKVEKILLALQRCVDGSNTLSATQINAARILLDKSIPSLTATAVSYDDPDSMPQLTIVRRNAA